MKVYILLIQIYNIIFRQLGGEDIYNFHKVLVKEYKISLQKKDGLIGPSKKVLIPILMIAAFCIISSSREEDICARVKRSFRGVL